MAGHTPAPRPPGRLARRGLIAVGAGLLAVAVATAVRGQALLGLGFVVMMVGFLLSIPLLVEWVGRAAAFHPSILRLAARQTARHGRRTGAAIAAATLALTVPVAVAAATLSEEGLESRTLRLSDDQLLVGGYTVDTGRSQPPSAFRTALVRTLPGSILVPLQYANVIGPDEGDTPYVEGAMKTIEEPNGTGTSYRVTGNLFIGTPEVLRAIHAERGLAALESGRIVAIGPDSTDHGQVVLHFDPSTTRERRVRMEAFTIDGPVYFDEQMPRWLISASAAGRLGMKVGDPDRWLLRGAHSLTRSEIDRARSVASRYPGAYVLSSDDLSSKATAIRLILLGASALVGLAIVAVAVALLATESRRDHAIMVAVGAEPRIRRTVVGTTAFFVAAMAAVLAVPAGFLPVAVVETLRTERHPIVVPWVAMVVILFAVPAIAAAFGAITSRQPKAATLLQPTW